MNNLIEKANKTPIEIALGIDEKGMTTAKKLYAFLELNLGNFARWCKTNIIENEFAEENVDFSRLFIEEETPTGGKILREDYKLTAHFAKKLSMLQKNEKGEEARRYFVVVEEKTKHLAETLQNLSPELQAIFTHDRKIQKVEKRVEAVDADLQDFKRNLPLLPAEAEQVTIAVSRRAISAMGGKESNSYKDKSLRGKVYSDIHRELKRQFGVTKYKYIKGCQLEVAISIIKNYELPIVLQEQIKDCNAQMNMEVA